MPRLRKLKFWTVAKEETDNWDSEVLARNGIRAAFGLYLIKEGEGTHLCELTPSSCALWVGNRFIFEDDATAEDWEDSEGLELEDGGETFSYLRFVDVEKHDSRFIAGPIEINPAELDDYGKTWEGNRNGAAWDAAQEAWNASPDEPAITWGTNGVYDAWQAELSAKRRALNVPPLSYRCGGISEPLPLFAAAAMAMLPGGQPTAETDAAFRQMRWL